MYRFQDIAPGATVDCLDGRLGILEYLQHDAQHGTVTHLIVRPVEGIGSLDLIGVSVDKIAEVPNPKRITLGCSIAEAKGGLTEREAGAGR